MPGKPFPTNVIKQAQAIIVAWNEINARMFFGNLNTSALTTDITTSTALQVQITSLEIQLSELRHQRDSVNKSLWDKVKRVRAGVKANYGDDSSQYEMIGGTRMSERKPPTRKIVKE